MKQRYLGIIIIEGIIILLLIAGMIILYFLLRSPATSASPLPVMPTYNPVFATGLPVTGNSQPVNTNQPAAATQTSQPLFILNGTPVYPTAQYIYPTQTPSLTPVVFIVPTVTPTPTNYAGSPPRPTCRNILYPVAPGQQWNYQAVARGQTADLNMNVLSVNATQGTGEVSVQSFGITKQTTVQCDGDTIRSFPFVNVDILLGSTLNSDMTVSYLSGVLAPNEAAFLQNNWALAWSSQYLLSGSTSINYNGTQLNVTFNNSPVTLGCQTLAAGDAAFETVTVTAGTFRALKVVCSEQGQVTAVVNGIPISGLAEGRSYQWFAPNIGLVKMQVDYANVNIFGASFSLASENRLELKSYISVP